MCDDNLHLLPLTSVVNTDLCWLNENLGKTLEKVSYQINPTSRLIRDVT